MARQLEPVDLGIITPLRRIRSVSIQTFWDESISPPQTQVNATFEYEIIYTDAEGKQVLPARHDGEAFLDDKQCRALPDFTMVYEAIASAGHAAKDAQTASVEVTPVGEI